MATEAGTDYSGVLCGRATWKDGMPIYATKGLSALEDFLSTKGVENIDAVNAALAGATPWYKKLGIAAKA
jgi:tagatose 1,6-diphosphate aldolase